MSYLDIPRVEEWEERRNWVENLNEKCSGLGSFSLSEHATALAAEIENTYCAGSWIAVIILSLSAIDAHLREIEFPNFKGNTKDLIDYGRLNHQLDTLRKRRNQLVHLNPEKPAVTCDNLFDEKNREKLKKEAEAAINLMFEIFYMSPWI
jgi:hypothetical protein